MRTREEQIVDIVSCLRFDNSGYAAGELTKLARQIIEETEQRVRAEIARDSERLDWLCWNIKGSEARRIVGVISDTGSVDLWRNAIDAAREVG